MFVNLNNATTCFFLETIKRQPSEYLDSLEMFCVFLHALTFLPAAIGNGFIVITTFKSPSLQKPSFVLLGCVAFADSLTGFLAQPVSMAYFVARLRRQFSLACLLGVIKECLGWLFSGISVSIIALLSVERYLVIHLGLRYDRVITLKRLLLIYCIFWVCLVCLGILRFFVLSNKLYVLFHLPFMFLGLFILTASYCKIYNCIRRQRLIKPITSAQQKRNSSFDMAKYRKITSAMLFCVCFYWLFFAPFVCVLLVYLLLRNTERVEGPYDVSTTIVLANAAVNPVLYCWRLRLLRQAVWRNIKQMLHMDSE